MTVTLMNISRGQDIEAESLRIIDSELPEPRPCQGAEWAIVRRLIHTTADFEMATLTRFHPQSVSAGIAALKAGCLILTDTEMARAGMTPRRLTPFGVEVKCFQGEASVAARAQAEGITRSRAAVDLAVERIAAVSGGPRPVIWAIGNAPTALIRLLEHVDAGRAKPALIIGMPVGFVNAAESKELLLARQDVPYISIQGRKGGSALAAATVNALAILAAQGE